MDNMRILVISNLFPPHYIGGYEVACCEAIQDLMHRGHTLQVMTSTYGLNEPEADNNKDVRVLRQLAFSHVRPVPDSITGWRDFWISGWQNGANPERVATIIQQFNPDMVYVWNTGGLGTAFILRAIHQQGLPYVVHLEDYHLRHRLRPRPYPQLIHQRLHRWLGLRHLIAVSQAVKNDYVRAGYPAENIKVIHNWIDEAIIKPQPRETLHSPLRLLFIGRISPEKGVHIAINAVAVLKEQGAIDFQLDIYGDGDTAYQAKLQQLIDTHDLPAQVKLQGKRPRSEIMKLYADYDILLMPAVWDEPLPITLLEALSVGMLVVASRVGGIPEVIEDGQNGLLVPPGDVVALAKGIITLANNGTLRDTITQNVEKKIRQFGRSRKIDEIEQYLQQVYRQEKGQ